MSNEISWVEGLSNVPGAALCFAILLIEKKTWDGKLSDPLFYSKVIPTS